jgi:epoxyqueuosine reductase QueG
MKFDSTAFLKDLEKNAREMGAKAFGVADLNKLKEEIPDLLNQVPGYYGRAIVSGIRLQKAVLKDISNQPTPLYFHNYRQVNYQLDCLALMLSDKIQDAGFNALAVPASQIIGKDPMRGHISHKLLGKAAGIGFLGRNTLLVHPVYGAQLRYVSVLTDMPLKAGTAHKGDCGTCMACVAVCPAKAIKEKREDFNLKACYEKLTEFTKLPFIGQHICGVCVKACAGRPKAEAGIKK